MRESGKETAHSIYNSLPRHVKTMPLIEALVGSHSHTLYDAIFDVELTPEQEIELFNEFDDEEEDALALRSAASRDSFYAANRQRSESLTPTKRRRNASAPRSNGAMTSSLSVSPMRRPKESLQSNPEYTSATSFPTVPTLKAPSPLARLFGAPRLGVSTSENANGISPTVSDDALAGIRKLENVLEGIRDLPVQRLKDEMKELQVSHELCFLLISTNSVKR